MIEKKKKKAVQIYLDEDLVQAIVQSIAEKQLKTGMRGDSLKKTIEDIASEGLKKVYIPSRAT